MGGGVGAGVGVGVGVAGNRNLRRGFLRSACALGGQMICGGLRRRDGLRSAGINLVAVQGNVSCVLRAPGQRGGLPGLNGSLGWLKEWRLALWAAAAVAARSLSFYSRLPPSTKNSTPRTTIRLLLLLFTSCPPKNNAIQYKALFKAPIRLAVAALARQLLQMRAVRQHAPDLFRAAAVRLKHNVPSIRRPRREVISPAIVSQLYDLS